MPLLYHRNIHTQWYYDVLANYTATIDGQEAI